MVSNCIHMCHERKPQKKEKKSSEQNVKSSAGSRRRFVVVRRKCLCHGFQQPRRPAACQTGGVAGGRGQGRNSTAVLLLDLERRDGNAGTLNCVSPLPRSRLQLSESHIHPLENTFWKKTHMVSGSKLWPSGLMVALTTLFFLWLPGCSGGYSKEGRRKVGLKRVLCRPAALQSAGRCLMLEVKQSCWVAEISSKYDFFFFLGCVVAF